MLKSLRQNADVSGGTKREIYLPTLICAMGVAVANLRPTMIGETQSFPLCVILVALEGAIILQFYHIKAALRFDKSAILAISLFVTVITYILTKAIVNPRLGGDDAFKAFAIAVAFIMAVAIALSNERYTRLFFDTFAIIMIASCASVMITFALVVAQIPATSLVVWQPPASIGYGGETGAFLFPLSYSNNEQSSWVGVIPRLAGLFREVGVFPPFACWAATYAYLRKWPIYLAVVCLMASLICLSTLGPLALYTGAMILLFKLRVKPLQAIVIVGVLGMLAWPALYAMEFIGLKGKIESHHGSGSFDDRNALIWAVLDTDDFIFGDGQGWSPVGAQEGISLVSQIRVHGLIYFFLVVGVYIASSMGGLRFWLAACVPALITVFFSQPMSMDPTFLMIFFSGAVFSNEQARAARVRAAEPGNLIRNANKESLVQ
jgi:hypothetical protein